MRSSGEAAVRNLVRAVDRTISTPQVLGGMLVVGLALRLLFIHADGFRNDVSSFESWSLTLAHYPLREFFAKAGFADYPPGYFFILAAIGQIYRLVAHSDPNFELLKVMVKLPAIFADLADAVLLFAIVRRCTPAATWAFVAAALLLFNPAAIYVSAYWGQVDSVAALFVLLAIWLLVRTDACAGRRALLAMAAAWLAIAYSILIKPPATVLVPLLLAYALAAPDPLVRRSRVRGTLAGVAAGFGLAYLAALAFHPGWNPLDQFAWLWHRYAYASNVYPYNSVNAFNLQAVWHRFWESDATIQPGWVIAGRTIGLPEYLWGIVLVVAAGAMVIARYVSRPTRTAFLEAAMLLSLGFFVLATRMHERYVFDAFVLVMPLVFVGRRYLIAAIVLTITLLGNLVYSLDYLHVMDQHLAGVDPTNLMPLLSKPLALANVVLYFVLGYRYIVEPGGERPVADADFGAFVDSAVARVRPWFAPGEGLATMTRVDYAIASGLTLVSFAIMFVNYWLPAEKIFDEIYYARAGAEYLKHIEIYEFTHPPLTKLIVALSMLLFGGLAHGDTSAGWRFLNVVIGALMIFIVYALAKRITGSTVYSTVAAGFVVFDGFHFVQSRIATPEITVAFFCLTTTYAFYRLWIASQVRIAPVFTAALGLFEARLLAAATVVALGLTYVVTRDQSVAAHVVAFAYFELGAYLAIRVLAPRWHGVQSTVSYPDGTVVSDDEIRTPDGGRLARGGAGAVPGSASRLEGDRLVLRSGELAATYARSGEARYVTPDGAAVYRTDGTLAVGDLGTLARDRRLWLWLLALSCAALAASKWNGLYLIGGIWTLVVLVAAQRYAIPLLRGLGIPIAAGPALLGNPRGFSADLVIGTTLLVAASGYTLSYIPYFTLGHNLADLVNLQYQMYHYHATLRATHPYSSVWWQWPLLQIPISYYWKDFRIGAATQNPHACCVAEILALPNPVVFWFGLASVPLVAWLAWREWKKGYVLLIAAYLFEWLPWAVSPRELTFEYHFFPNLAVIAICDAIVLERFARWLTAQQRDSGRAAHVCIGLICAVVVAAFVYWYPVLAGVPIRWDDWNARMLTPLMHNLWINPHPGQ